MEISSSKVIHLSSKVNGNYSNFLLWNVILEKLWENDRAYTQNFARQNGLKDTMFEI